MSEMIIEFIEQYITLTDREKTIIQEAKFIRSFKKGEVILREGELSKRCFFVLKGCVRSYYLHDGEEKNTEFFVETDTIVPASYITKTPSQYFLSCMEDSLLSVASPEQTAILIEKVPKLKELIIHLNQHEVVKKQIMYDDLKNLSAEERYLKLIDNRPDLLHRIPQYHLATFLGITPVSLSRLRKQMADRKS